VGRQPDEAAEVPVFTGNGWGQDLQRAGTREISERYEARDSDGRLREGWHGVAIERIKCHARFGKNQGSQRVRSSDQFVLQSIIGSG